MVNISNSYLFRQQCFIAGVWCDANSKETIDVENPATKEKIAQVPQMGSAEILRAIDSAYIAGKEWRKKTAKERSKILHKWFTLIMENQEDLAIIMTSEQGKPLAESRGEIAYGASFIEWFAEEGKRIYGDVIPTVQNDKRIIVTKEPIGVCAAITPWNFPSSMITRKAAPALAAGCTMVVKPASQTPLSALALAYLAQLAGIPDGVFSVIVGDENEIGKEMTENSKVRKLTFTGSTGVGAKLIAQCAPSIKKVSMELGGNAPFIVFNDANLDAAVEGAMISKYRNSGQTCVCANRMLVQEGVAEKFADKLALAVKKLTLGNGLDTGVQQGPLIDEKAVVKIEEMIADALNKGAKLLCGGKRHSLGKTFYEPTIISGVTSKMRIACEEIFGPVAPIITFKDDEEAIKIANDTEFGLASYFYSNDLSRIWKIAEALEYGMVGINTGIISNEVAPFGGMKSSGLGREGSKYGIDDYLEIKYLCMGGL